jgi:hypothetical protein
MLCTAPPLTARSMPAGALLERVVLPLDAALTPALRALKAELNSVAGAQLPPHVRLSLLSALVAAPTMAGVQVGASRAKDGPPLM